MADDKFFSDRHLASIGLFIISYGMMEALVHGVFARYSGIPYDIGRALVGGNRLKDVIAATKRIMKLRTELEQHIQGIETIEGLLDPISKLRDKIVHRTWTFTSDGLPGVINATGAKSRSAIKIEEISTEEIEKNISNLVILCGYLFAHAKDGVPWGTLNDEQREEILGSLLDIFPGQDKGH